MLECRDLGWDDRLRNISLTVSEGEVVGLGGLDGQGQRDLLLALFGVLRGTTGEILIDGKPKSIASPSKACDRSIGMVFELQDITRLAKAARAQGITTVIDNSWATPIFQKPITHEHASDARRR